jgi:hypothetical protein
VAATAPVAPPAAGTLAVYGAAVAVATVGLSTGVGVAGIGVASTAAWAGAGAPPAGCGGRVGSSGGGRVGIVRTGRRTTVTVAQALYGGVTWSGPEAQTVWLPAVIPLAGGSMASPPSKHPNGPPPRSTVFCQSEPSQVAVPEIPHLPREFGG